MNKYYDPYKHVEILADEIERLEAELAEERKKSTEYLSNWIAAQDLAAYRNMLLIAKQ